jgi:hypothetical protein
MVEEDIQGMLMFTCIYAPLFEDVMNDIYIYIHIYYICIYYTCIYIYIYIHIHI